MPNDKKVKKKASKENIRPTTGEGIKSKSAKYFH